jgi:hypothetical protein
VICDKALSAQSRRGPGEEAERAALAELQKANNMSPRLTEISTASDPGAQTISEMLAGLVTEHAPTVLLTIATAMAGLVLSFADGVGEKRWSR